MCQSGGSAGKESACNAGDLGSILGFRRFPGEGNGQPTPLFLPGKYYGQRILVGYSPWGHKYTFIFQRGTHQRENSKPFRDN